MPSIWVITCETFKSGFERVPLFKSLFVLMPGIWIPTVFNTVGGKVVKHLVLEIFQILKSKFLYIYIDGSRAVVV